MKVEVSLEGRGMCATAREDSRTVSCFSQEGAGLAVAECGASLAPSANAFT